MATKIVTKNSSTASAVPTASDLVQGELAVNVADKRLFTEDNAGAIVELGTNPSTLTVTGEITANGGIALGDNDKATFGVGDDLQIYHEPNNSIIKASVGSLLIQGDNIRLQKVDGTENMLTAVNDGQLKLFYDGAEKIATTSTGIDVTGTATMDGLTVGNSTDTQGKFSGWSVIGANSSSGAIELGQNSAYQGIMSYVADGNTRFLFDNTYNSTGSTFEFRTNTAATAKTHLKIGGSGDISFYEDTGTTPKFFWDASAESLGIGNSNPQGRLHLNDSGTSIPTSGYGTGMMVSRTDGLMGTMFGFLNSPQSGYLQAANFTNTGTLPFLINPRGGNVGIGTSSPTLSTAWNTVLHVKSAALGAELRLADSDSGGVGDVGLSVGQYGGNSYIINKDGGGTFFWTGGTERMRIDSSGNLLVGTTNNVLSSRAFFESAGSTHVIGSRVGANGHYALGAINASGTVVGGVVVNASSTTFATSSDQRLKENIADADDSGELIDAIQVRKFDWKADGSHQDYGMIAQELQAVAPEAVSGDADSEEMMGVDYSKLVPMLIKEIQSLRNRVAQLEE